eukprot:14376214-Alexandrium_andersonii.AAC.1
MPSLWHARCQYLNCRCWQDGDMLAATASPTPRPCNRTPRGVSSLLPCGMPPDVAAPAQAKIGVTSPAQKKAQVMREPTCCREFEAVG